MKYHQPTDRSKHYYYRPLRHFPHIFKCAGHGAEDPQHRAFYEPFFNSAADCQEHNFRPGVVILRGYFGDRITKDKLGHWQEID